MSSEFKDRLAQACRMSTKVPAFGEGRNERLAERLKVSPEAVRQWFSGGSVPRASKIKALAELLGCDEAWLGLGVEPGNGEQKTKRVRVLAEDGAVQVISGLVMLSGGTCALPADTDKRSEFVDLYAIIGGTQLSLGVELAEALEGGNQYSVAIRKKFEEVVNIVVVHRAVDDFDVLVLDHSLIQKNVDRRKLQNTLVIDKTGDDYSISGVPCQKLNSFEVLYE